MNVIQTLKSRGGVVRSEFDIVYERGLFLAKKKVYVECKYRGKESLVAFSDVATFTGKLELIDVPYKQGEMVTNTRFDDRSYAYADKVGLRLIDGSALYKLKKKTLGPIERLKLRYTNQSLESLL